MCSFLWKHQCNFSATIAHQSMLRTHQYKCIAYHRYSLMLNSKPKCKWNKPPQQHCSAQKKKNQPRWCLIQGLPWKGKGQQHTVHTAHGWQYSHFKLLLLLKFHRRRTLPGCKGHGCQWEGTGWSHPPLKTHYTAELNHSKPTILMPPHICFGKSP